MNPPSLNELQDALSFVDAGVSRDEWTKILMGIKNEFGEDGFDVADMWSQGGSSYNKEGFKSTWRSIKPSGGITIATVFKIAIDNGYKPQAKEYSEAEKAEFKRVQEERAKRRAEQEQQARKETENWHQCISQLAIQIIENFSIPIKSNKYLSTKKVQSFGCLGIKQAFVVVVRPDFRTEIVTGGANISAFFNDFPEKDKRDFWCLHVKRGELLLPLMDIEKRIWNIQIIKNTGTKMFLKHGKKSGCFHFIGKASESETLAIAEGYATAASIHMATKWPCIVAWDAGNLPVVAKLFKEKLPQKQFVICADNDINTKDNAGVTKAKEAAEAISGLVAIPDFSCVKKDAA